MGVIPHFISDTMNSETKKTFVMLLPALIAMLLFLIPLYHTIRLSFLDSDFQFAGLDAYRDVFSDPNIVNSFLFTLMIAFVSTLISAILAIVVAMALRRTFVGKKLAVFLFQFNIPIPQIAFTMMVLLLLLNTGFLSRLFYSFGFISSASDFPVLVYDRFGVGIIVSYVLKFIPFIGMSILAILQNSAQEYEDQSQVLGANRFQTFIHILLPMIMPALASTTIITFAYAFGTFEVPMLIGGSENLALPVMAYIDYTSIDPTKRPISYAMCSLMTLFILILSSAYALMMSRGERR